MGYFISKMNSTTDHDIFYFGIKTTDVQQSMKCFSRSASFTVQAIIFAIHW